MNEISQTGKLYWDSSFEIALDLCELYPQAELEKISLNELHHYIVTLPNFADDPELGNDSILTDILREWFEEVNP
jgi:FeS assembly protein IscX